MIELIEKIDTRLFLFFNGNHTPFMDMVMGVIGDRRTWIPLYLLLLYFVWKKKGKGTWLIMLAAAILITLSDQISVHLFKEVFQRYRPCHNLLLQGKVQLINGYCGGQYGFISSHAANAFALATFLGLFFRRMGFVLSMYLWASVVSYSRVYAGVHYPFDIMGGMMLGIFMGLLVYKFYVHYDKKYNPNIV